MDRRKLNNLRRKHESLRSSRGDISARQLVGLATSLGRSRKKKQTGEPMYVSDVFPLRPIPIPAHSKISPKTAIKILTWLEDDFFYWDEKLRQQEIQTKKTKNHEKGAKNEESG
jgi:hypothetical protein